MENGIENYNDVKSSFNNKSYSFFGEKLKFVFPPQNNKKITSKQIEDCFACKDVNNFFDCDGLRIDKDMDKSFQSRGKSFNLSMSQLMNLHVGLWLTGDLIHTLMRFLLRNPETTKKVVCLEFQKIERLFSFQLERPSRNGKVSIDSVFQKIYGDIALKRSKKKKKENIYKLTDYDYWMIPENVDGILWCLTIVCHVNFF